MQVFCVNCRFINRAICHLIVNLLVNYNRKSSKTYENAQNAQKILIYALLHKASGPDSTWFRPLGLMFETYFRAFVLYFALWTTVTLTHWNKGGEWGKNRKVEKDEGLKLCFWQNEELHSHETFIWHLFDPAQLKNSKGLGYDWHRDSNSDTKLSKKLDTKLAFAHRTLKWASLHQSITGKG